MEIESLLQSLLDLSPVIAVLTVWLIVLLRERSYYRTLLAESRARERALLRHIAELPEELVANGH